jgi:hypothetical protein
MPSHIAYQLVLSTFCVNLPFGAYRSTVRRLSWRWFLAIHLPIPAIFLLRTSAGYSYWFIPWLVLGAAGGQALGGLLLAAWRGRRAHRDTEPSADTSRVSDEGRATVSAPTEHGQPALERTPSLLGQPDEEPLGGLR